MHRGHTTSLPAAASDLDSTIRRIVREELKAVQHEDWLRSRNIQWRLLKRDLPPKEFEVRLQAYNARNPGLAIDLAELLPANAQQHDEALENPSPPEIAQSRGGDHE